MSGLVGYGSSDEEEDDVQLERPSKIAKTGAHNTSNAGKATDEHTIAKTLVTTNAEPPTSAREPSIQISPTGSPAPGPSAPQSVPSPAPSTSGSAPASPHTQERQRLRDLTMPTLPNFSIPDSPPPPQTSSEEAAALSATTRKFQRFLDLKKQGTHFNSRLATSASLRNSSLLPKLMDFAQMNQEESYVSTLPEEVGVRTRWPEQCYVENLVKVNEKREKKRVAQREKVEFVPAATKSAGSSAVGTPKGATSRDKGRGAERKSRFDR